MKMRFFYAKGISLMTILKFDQLRICDKIKLKSLIKNKNMFFQKKKKESVNTNNPFMIEVR